MDKKTFLLPVALFLAAALVVGGFVLLKKHIDSIAPPPVAVVEQPVTESEPEEAEPAPERRHGPKVRRKVDIGSQFSGMTRTKKDAVAAADPEEKELHEQTPAEAVESAWQALDTYRDQSPEEREQTRFALAFVSAIVDAIGANAAPLVAELDDQQRADAVANAMTTLDNIDAIEQEVAPDMTDEERQTIGGIYQSIRNLNRNLLYVLQ